MFAVEEAGGRQRVSGGPFEGEDNHKAAEK